MPLRHLLAALAASALLWVVGFSIAAHAQLSPSAGAIASVAAEAGAPVSVAAPLDSSPAIDATKVGTPAEIPAPVAKFGAAALVVAAVLRLLISLFSNPSLGSVWSKMPVIVKVGAIAVFTGLAAGATAYANGQGLWAAVGATVLGVMGGVQHGSDLAAPVTTTT